MNKEIDNKYMKRCIQLAMNGLGSVSPNPMVGAVIVCDDKIIGEGYHRKCGEAHAEVNAINSVKDQSLLKRSTIYVSLEPCSHYGKTPPCADLIIEKKIPRIVIGCQDPFAKVAGQGIKKLQMADREVTVGVLEDECRWLIRTFITAHTKQRPYITLKWAESSDGFIDLIRTKGKAAKLSSELTSMLVHKRRAEIDGIMVGTRTALLDNPSLTVRNWFGKNPIRIVVDRELKISKENPMLSGNEKTIVFTSLSKPYDDSLNNEYITIDFNDNPLQQILYILYKKGIHSLMVEGGSALLQSFIDQNLWDEAFVEKASIKLIEGVKAPQIIHSSKTVCDKHFGVDIWHYVR